MLANLDKVRKDNEVTLTDMADAIHVRYQTVADKINGVSDFKFNEALLIQQKFFPEYDLKYLFAREELQEV